MSSGGIILTVKRRQRQLAHYSKACHFRMYIYIYISTSLRPSRHRAMTFDFGPRSPLDTLAGVLGVSWVPVGLLWSSLGLL